ncbi:MAG: preprotein translocase subunit SecG [Acidobacteriota bacterium]
MFILVTIIHVIVSLFLVIVVLLQSGKAADLAGAFGGLGSQTVFGPRGSATVLTRATTISAVLFMITSMTLSILSTSAPATGGSNSLLDKITAPASTPAPAAPGAPGAPTTALPNPASPATIPLNVEVAPQGSKGTPTTVQVPVVPAPTDQKQAPKQK